MGGDSEVILGFILVSAVEFGPQHKDFVFRESRPDIETGKFRKKNDGKN